MRRVAFSLKRFVAAGLSAALATVVTAGLVAPRSPSLAAKLGTVGGYIGRCTMADVDQHQCGDYDSFSTCPADEVVSDCGIAPRGSEDCFSNGGGCNDSRCQQQPNYRCQTHVEYA